MEGLDNNVDWEEPNICFKQRRTKVNRKYMDLKTKVSVAEDGILNYSKKLPAIQKRFCGDFEFALKRVKKAATGLKNVFGFDDEFPSNHSALVFFDDCLIWTRKMINKLNQFSRLDQNFTITISLQDLLGKDEWSKGKKSGSWSFKVADNLFPNQFHLRLRGISVFLGKLRINRLNGTISALVKAPVNSYYTHLNHSKVEVDQSEIPAIRCGRIGTRDFIRTRDVFGVNTLFNVSPLGTWKISLLTSNGKN